MLAFFRTLLAVIVGFFIIIFLFFAFIAVIAMGSKSTVNVKNNSILVLKLDKPIPERDVDNPLKEIPILAGDLDFPVSLQSILASIRHAKEDDRIKGIYIEPDLLRAGMPTVEEIRNALIDFKQSGKFIYAYSELYTQKNYYLVSVADSIFLNPNGLFSFAGFHSEQIFFKGTLDKLDVKMNLIRAGKYKSAGEMFINSGMSEANRQQITDYINSVYGDFLQKVGTARHIETAELRHIADSLLIRFPQDAVSYKLIDKTAYKDQVLRSLRAKLGIAENKDIHKIDVDEYAKAEHPLKHSGNGRIALIYAVGDIMGGEGSDEQIGSEKFSEAIRKARMDDKVKAIVLRVNSPGGSALASDIIWREVVLAKQKKPVIASFGDLAASGGYYIAAPADMIYAEPNSLTGSIGVFGLLPTLKDFWNNKLGITFDRVRTGKYVGLGNPNREMTPEERQIIQTYIDTTYQQFKQRVASGRKLAPAFVDSIAQGHIYSGIQAQKLGLVDKLGNLEDAIAMAAEKAGLDNYSIKVMPEFKSDFRKILMSMTMVKEQFIQSELQENYYMFKKMNDAGKLQGVLMYYPFDVNVY